MSDAQPRQWKKVVLKVGLVLIGAIAVVLLLIPPVISSSMVKNKVLELIQPSIDGKVELAELKFGWNSGVKLREFSVGQPKGYGDDAALAVPAIDLELGFLSLMFGTPSVRVTVNSPTVQIIRKSETETNWQDLLSPSKSAAAKQEEEPDSASKGGKRAASKRQPREFDFRGEFHLSGGTIQFVDSVTDTKETLRNLNIDVVRTDAGEPVSLTLKAEIDRHDKNASGYVELDADFDMATERWDARLRTDGLNLEYWEPLFVALGYPVESLRGSIQGDLHSSGAPDKEAVVGGKITISDFHWQRPGHTAAVQIPAISIQPDVVADLATNAVDTSGLLVDTGFLTLRGISTAERPEEFQNDHLAAGFEVSVALAGLEDSGLLPRLNLGGDVNVKLWAAAVAAASGLPSFEQPLRFSLQTSASKLEVPDSMLPQAAAPQGFTVAGRGSFATADSRLALESMTLDSEVLRLDGTLQGVLDQLAGTMTIDVLEKPLQALLHRYGTDALQSDGPLGVKVEINSMSVHRLTTLEDALQSLQTSVAIACPAISFLENRLADLGMDLTVADQVAELNVHDDAALNGGALLLALRFQQKPQQPVHGSLDLNWQGGRAGGSLTPGLQYVVPLLAGFDPESVDDLARIEFDSTAALELSCAGPALRSKEQTWLDYLSQWSGHGMTSLTDGSVTLAAGFSELAQFLDEDRRQLEFSEIVSNFELSQGRIRVPELKFIGNENPLLISGSTDLRGAIDYELDLSMLLQDHATGQKVLELLGDADLVAKLDGSLSAPNFKMTDLAAQSLKDIGGNLLENLQKDPKSTIDQIRGLFDDDDDDNKKKKQKKKPRKKNKAQDPGGKGND